MQLLFESRTNLGLFSGQISFFQQRPQIHPEAVIRPDSFVDRKAVSIYGSVLAVNGRLRMWYHAYPEDWNFQGDLGSIAYAESEDGIHWTKPALEIVSHGPDANNLTDLGLHSAAVFVDPSSPRGSRYRAVGCGYRNYFLANPAVGEPGYYTAHSADGLRWKLDAAGPRWRSSDVITAVYHPGRECGVVAMKFSPRVGRMKRRSIHTAELRAGEYSEPISALYPDEFDDISAVQRGFHTGDYYGMGMMPAGQGMVGFIWNYWHGLPYTGAGHFGLYGSSDITLAYQPEPDGRWLHVPGRPTFIDRHALPWSSGWINTAANVVEVGDQHRLYFSGQPYSHGFGVGADWRFGERWADYMSRHPQSGITFAWWPKWRLFGFESDPEGSFTINLGAIEQAGDIVLNYQITKPGGSIRCELRGEGFATRNIADSVPLEGDSIGEIVCWRSGEPIPATTSARITLHLDRAKVFAYEFRPRSAKRAPRKNSGR